MSIRDGTVLRFSWQSCALMKEFMGDFMCIWMNYYWLFKIVCASVTYPPHINTNGKGTPSRNGFDQPCMHLYIYFFNEVYIQYYKYHGHIFTVTSS